MANGRANRITSGSFGFDALAEILTPGIRRQYPFIAGSLFPIQYFEVSPVISGSNGIRILVAP